MAKSGSVESPDGSKVGVVFLQQLSELHESGRGALLVQPEVHRSDSR